MYSKLSKGQAFPLAFRVSSQSPKCFAPMYTSKPQSSELGSHSKLSSYPSVVSFSCSSYGFLKKASHQNSQLLGTGTCSVGIYNETLGKKECSIVKSRCFSSGFCAKPGMRNYPLAKVRFFSSSVADYSDGGSRDGKSLPWLAAGKDKEEKRFVKLEATKTRSSWEESAEKFLKSGSAAVRESRVDRRFDRRNDYKERRNISEEDEEMGENEEGNDPRWYKIRSRFDRVDSERPRFQDGPKSRTWSKQENWGKKTLKEAVESRASKMVGEGIYGVGPVLAALSAGRREFYALYVQEGLDLSGNNRKKKDKKGFEKVLKISDKLGISRVEISKHDLNVFVDNRPHQGLVLDASPLEMVNIRELDRLSSDGEAYPLWVALDEVTDPQNLGAIIRSAYFFGVSGVVLCAKNSAPLSGVVSKASAGALELTELRSCKNMMQFLVSSAENGWRVLGGSVSSKAVPLNEVGTSQPTILVLGSEGTGLRPLVERSCTELIRIPGNIPMNVSAGFEDAETGEMEQKGSGEEFQSFMAVESLNVSVAAGVLLHHLVGTNNNNTS